MKLKVTCKCGAQLEMSALGVRDVDIQWWIQLHAHCYGMTVEEPDPK